MNDKHPQSISFDRFTFNRAAPRIWLCDQLPDPVSVRLEWRDNNRFRAAMWTGRTWHYSECYGTIEGAGVTALDLLADVGVIKTRVSQPITGPTPDERTAAALESIAALLRIMSADSINRG